MGGWSRAWLERKAARFTGDRWVTGEAGTGFRLRRGPLMKWDGVTGPGVGCGWRGEFCRREQGPRAGLGG